MTTIIACDFATITGFAIAYGGKIDCTGTESFKPKRGDSPGFKWHLFRIRFGELLDEQKPDLLVYELPFIASMKSATVAEVAFGMVTRAKEMCDERGIEYRGVPNNVIKQWATGSGNANKEAMQRAAAAKWPFYRADRDEGANEADAAFLLDYALAGFPDLAAAKAKAAAEKKAAAKAAKDAAAAERTAAALQAVLWHFQHPESETYRRAYEDLSPTIRKRAVATLAGAGRIVRQGRGWRLA